MDVSSFFDLLFVGAVKSYENFVSVNDSESDSCWLEGTIMACERSIIFWSLPLFLIGVVVEEEEVIEDRMLLFGSGGDSVVSSVSFVVFWLEVEEEMVEVVVEVRFGSGAGGGSCAFVVLYLLVGGWVSR